MKLKKKAFSMIELLFAMIIMAALAAIAIPSLSSGTNSATYTSMKSDIANAITTTQGDYIVEGKYDNSDGDFEDQDNDGLADTGGINDDGYIGNKRVHISKGNTLYINPQDCSGDGVNDGVYIGIANDNVERVIRYNSCTTAKLQLEDN